MESQNDSDDQKVISSIRNQSSCKSTHAKVFLYQTISVHDNNELFFTKVMKC
jgi:hypothetical protein